MHIFLDNSNFFHGLQHHRRVSPLCIDVNFLYHLFVGQDTGISKSFVIGTGMDTPQHDNVYWQQWKAKGFTVLAARQKNKELFVDDCLHAQILHLLFSTNRKKRNKLVLVSGDGNLNDNRTSFPTCVEIALKIGWTVDIWCWQEGMHHVWLQLQKQYTQQLHVFHFNNYLSRIVNYNQQVNHIYPYMATEEDRLYRAMIETDIYAQSIRTQCPSCRFCGKHRRTPRQNLCQCNYPLTQKNHRVFVS